MPSKSCLEPYCPEPSAYRGRCALHSKQRERTINRTGKKEYRLKRWTILRRRVLFEQPICAIEGCNELSTDVDHIQPLGQGGEMWARSNLWGLCHHHHSVKTRAEQMGVA